MRARRTAHLSFNAAPSKTGGQLASSPSITPSSLTTAILLFTLIIRLGVKTKTMYPLQPARMDVRRGRFGKAHGRRGGISALAKQEGSVADGIPLKKGPDQIGVKISFDLDESNAL